MPFPMENYISMTLDHPDGSRTVCMAPLKRSSTVKLPQVLKRARGMKYIILVVNPTAHDISLEGASRLWTGEPSKIHVIYERPYLRVECAEDLYF